jgi:hypothetical protein
MFSIPQPLTRLLVILVQQIDHPSPSKTKFETEKKGVIKNIKTTKKFTGKIKEKRKNENYKILDKRAGNKLELHT